MKKAFISYRRQDSAGYSRALHNHLVQHFSPDQIFMDVDDIPLGTDFVQELNENLQGCTVMLVMIGPQWLDIRDRQGKRRLDKPGDFVRIEIEQAFNNGLTVIPILVNGASMPTEQALPKSIQSLSRRQALTLDNKHYDHGMRDLISALELHLGKPETTPPPAILPAPEQTSDSASSANKNPWRLPAIFSLLLITVIAIAAVTYFLSEESGNSGILSNKDSDHTHSRQASEQQAAQQNNQTSSENLSGVLAGFDCRKASTDVEDAICNDSDTRKADLTLNQSYQQISLQLPPEAQQQLWKRQQSWLKQRNSHIRQNCFTQPNQQRVNHCIVTYYQQRISTLVRLPSSLLSRVKTLQPPAEIKTAPNADTICQVSQQQMITVYTDAVRERDGDNWYWTQVCGKNRWGVIHESKISTVR